MAPSSSKSNKAGKKAETAEKEKENGNGRASKSDEKAKVEEDEDVARPPESMLCTIIRLIFDFVVESIKLVLMLGSCLWAYRVRLTGIPVYGYMIHGFDPTFNFTAARYLARKGWHEFFRWYDYMSWYPLGRPVGTTIYPGMQILSVWLWRAFEAMPTGMYKIPKEVLAWLPNGAAQWLPGHGMLTWGPRGKYAPEMTLNNVCVMTGPWMSAIATFFLAMTAAECSESTGVGVVAAFVFAGIPAHLMRSMAGEFDNEAHAMMWFCATFYFWCRSLRTIRSWPWALLAAACYGCSVATWGGYIFVNNLIGLHAAVLVVQGKFNSGAHRAYSLWYVLGTAAATFVPVVGWTPLKSLEQAPAALVFFVYQLLELCDMYRRRQKKGMQGWEFFLFRARVFAGMFAGALVVCLILHQMNYFSPLSSRIRALFLRHQRTGNPLVDSVAEHQPSNASSYETYLGASRHFAVVGLLLCWHQRTPAKSFPFIFAWVAYTFSLKMSRLIIICGPVCSMLAAYPVGIVYDWCLEQLVGLACGPRPARAQPAPPPRTGGMGSILAVLWKIWPQAAADAAGLPQLLREKERFAHDFPEKNRMVRAAIAGVLVACSLPTLLAYRSDWVEFCEEISHSFAGPGLVFQARGGTLVTDKYVGYEWLVNNTPADSRVLSWWDYGYQITGIGNRTSVADGNTWNHEHIATIGRILSAPEKKSYNTMRHLADYVLVHAGHQETDLRISTHFARIGNSIFPDICGDADPTCTKYGFLAGGQPSRMMAKSFVYKAVKHGQDGVQLNPNLFKEVHETKYGMIRIFQVLNVSQESKDWVANPANRKCDAPGSWYCVGQYPPALAPLIALRKDFAQLEDFNKKGEKSAYTKMIEARARKGLAEE